MAKTLSGGALIAYGPNLPAVGSAPDGALFYKTDSLSGGPQGLYVYGFLKDANSTAIGHQVSQGWVQATSPDVFVLKTGDTMSGSLQVPDVIRITNITGATNSQRLLIGNSNNNTLPMVIDSYNGTITIANGTNWGTGGTIGVGLSITPAGGISGLTWQGNQIWHASNDGAGSTLDADLLDGQHGAYYLNLGTGTTSNFTGILPVARGGTGNSAAPAIGGVVYGASATSFSSVAGSSGQILKSNGSVAPSWVDQSSLSVGNAAQAANATYATTAGAASTATLAMNTPWTGITGFNNFTSGSFQDLGGTPMSGANTIVRPSYFFEFASTGTQSPAPTAFPYASITGFDAVYSSDIGQYNVGLTISGNTSNGARAAQIAVNWNFEETAPAGGMKYRVNDDTSNTAAWGAWQTLWDQGNLTNLSQLTNGPGYLTSSTAVSAGFMTQTASDARYVSLTGSTMSGTLRSPQLVSSNVDGSGGFELWSSVNGVRQAYIGISSRSASQDAGSIRYQAGTHVFGGVVNTLNGIQFANGTTQTTAALPLTGGTMTGTLTLAGDATTALGAVTKQQLDAKVSAAAYVFTSGLVAGTTGYVYPPSGYTMANLVAFIPSINQIYFNGYVDNNDSLLCYYVVESTQIRVVVYASEQRSTPYASWLAVWK